MKNNSKLRRRERKIRADERKSWFDSLQNSVLEDERQYWLDHSAKARRDREVCSQEVTI